MSISPLNAMSEPAGNPVTFLILAQRPMLDFRLVSKKEKLTMGAIFQSLGRTITAGGGRFIFLIFNFGGAT